MALLCDLIHSIEIKFIPFDWLQFKFDSLQIKFKFNSNQDWCFRRCVYDLKYITALQNNMIYNYKISCVIVLFCLFFLFFFVVLLNLGFSGHATIVLVLWIHCFHLHVLTSDVVSLLPFLDSISLIIIVVQCRV